MGCNSTKESKTSIKSLNLPKVGVASLDAFIAKVTDIVNRFADLTDDIEKKQNHMYNLYDFVYVNRKADRTLRIAFLSVNILFISTANGDMSKVKIDVIDKEPYFKIAVNNLGLDKADDYIKAFEDCVTTTVHAVTDKMPKLLEEMTKLESELEGVQENAKSEFEGLDGIQKAKALMNAGKVTKDLPKIPAFMKQTIANMQKELD